MKLKVKPEKLQDPIDEDKAARALVNEMTEDFDSNWKKKNTEERIQSHYLWGLLTHFFFF